MRCQDQASAWLLSHQRDLSLVPGSVLWLCFVLAGQLCLIQRLPEAVRSCSKLVQLDVAANDDLDALPTGAYLTNLQELDLSRCDFHR